MIKIDKTIERDVNWNNRERVSFRVEMPSCLLWKCLGVCAIQSGKLYNAYDVAEEMMIEALATYKSTEDEKNVSISVHRAFKESLEAGNTVEYSANRAFDVAKFAKYYVQNFNTGKHQ